MPLLDRDVTLTVIDRTYGITAAVQRGTTPPNGIAKLAEQTGIKVRVLREAVQGRDPIAEYRLVLIARALGVQPEHLIAQADPKPQPPPKPKTAPKVEPVAPPARRREPSGPPRVDRGTAA